MRFKFDYLNNRFWRIEGEYSYEIPEERTFASNYGGQGFLFDSEQPNHWISFTIYYRNIRVFYKQVTKNQEITYYQKDLPKQEIIEFELGKDDIVAKKNGRWTKNKE